MSVGANRIAAHAEIFLTSSFCLLMRRKPRAEEPTNSGVSGTPARVQRPTTQSMENMAAQRKIGIAMATQICTK
jgi:hypothetical protein